MLAEASYTLTYLEGQLKAGATGSTDADYAKGALHQEDAQTFDTLSRIIQSRRMYGNAIGPLSAYVWVKADMHQFQSVARRYVSRVDLSYILFSDPRDEETLVRNVSRSYRFLRMVRDIPESGIPQQIYQEAQACGVKVVHMVDILHFHSPLAYSCFCAKKQLEKTVVVETSQDAATLLKHMQRVRQFQDLRCLISKSAAVATLSRAGGITYSPSYEDSTSSSAAGGTPLFTMITFEGSAMEQRLAAAREAYASAERESRQADSLLEAESREVARDRPALSQRENELRARQAAINSDISNLEKDIERIQHTYTRSLATREKRVSDLERAKANYADTSASISRIHREIADVRDSQLPLLRTQLEEAKASVCKWEAEEKEWRAKLSEARQQEGLLREEVRRLEQEIFKTNQGEIGYELQRNREELTKLVVLEGRLRAEERERDQQLSDRCTKFLDDWEKLRAVREEVDQEMTQRSQKARASQAAAASRSSAAPGSPSTRGQPAQPNSRNPSAFKALKEIKAPQNPQQGQLLKLLQRLREKSQAPQATQGPQPLQQESQQTAPPVLQVVSQSQDLQAPADPQDPAADSTIMGEPQDVQTAQDSRDANEGASDEFPSLPPYSQPILTTLSVVGEYLEMDLQGRASRLRKRAGHEVIRLESILSPLSHQLDKINSALEEKINADRRKAQDSQQRAGFDLQEEMAKLNRLQAVFAEIRGETAQINLELGPMVNLCARQIIRLVALRSRAENDMVMHFNQNARITNLSYSLVFRFPPLPKMRSILIELVDASIRNQHADILRAVTDGNTPASQPQTRPDDSSIIGMASKAMAAGSVSQLPSESGPLGQASIRSQSFAEGARLETLGKRDEATHQGSINIRSLNLTAASCSGGEGTFLSLCFLTSCWLVMQTSYAQIDEWDVYMDAARRRAAFGMLMEVLSKTNVQCVLVTPNDVDMSGVSQEVQKLVGIIRLEGIRQAQVETRVR